MASFNLVNVFFLYLLIYFKFADSSPGLNKSLTSSSQPVYFTINGNIAILNENGSRSILRYDNGWSPIYSGAAEGKSVNVQYKKHSNNYHCVTKGKVHTYTAKDNGLFTKVRSQVGDGIEHVLFETKDFPDMATKVVYDERDSNNLKVTIYHVNGLTRTMKPAPGGRWQRVQPSASAPETKSNKVEIKIQSHANNPGVRIESDDKYLKYDFYGGSKCLNVSYYGKEVMNRYSTDPVDSYPSSVYFSLKCGRIVVNFKDSVDIFRFQDEELKTVFSGKPVPKSLNVQFKDSCVNYDCFGGHKVYSYTPKNKGLFNKVRSAGVKEVGEVIFETSDVLEMANEVAYDESSSTQLVVTIHHVNGLTRTFTKHSNGNWEESEPKCSDTKQK